MVKILDSYKRLSLDEISEFELVNKVKFTKKYKGFLLQYNGGYPESNLFRISGNQGVTVLNQFYGIGDMYNNLEDYIDIYEYRLPCGFIPIADDPSGNVICLGTEGTFYDEIYFWDHEQESEDPNDMSNMYLLANNINEFLETLYSDTEG